MRDTRQSPSHDADKRSDSWERFERAVDAAVKSGPKHKPAAKPSNKKAVSKDETK